MTTDPSSDVVERLAYTVANAKLGEGPSVRCEGPTEYEISQARQWVKRVMQAQDATIERLSAERMQLREALTNPAAAASLRMLRAHYDKACFS